jgi:hypothetical protein
MNGPSNAVGCRDDWSALHGEPMKIARRKSRIVNPHPSIPIAERMGATVERRFPWLIAGMLNDQNRRAQLWFRAALRTQTIAANGVTKFAEPRASEIFE